MTPNDCAAPFSILLRAFGDPEMSRIFSEESTVRAWLQVETALAAAHAETGQLTASDAEAIADVCRLETIEMSRLWGETGNVGYPIFPLVHQLAEALPEGPNGRVHYGATTQDIMDSGLALQISLAIDRNAELIAKVGDALIDLIEREGDALIAARTHAQQAVPTTLGAKLAVFLSQFEQLLIDAESVRKKCCRISLFGAGGTAAALGEDSAEIRRSTALKLGLEVADVPWHVDRTGLVAFAVWCDTIASVAMRLAREVIDLSRTEIGEVAELGGHLRGSSSTMPQKSNPISSEVVMGLGMSSHALLSAAVRTQEAGHERSSGEWQAEWHILPQMAVLAASSLLNMDSVVRGLEVNRERMSQNLELTRGLILAEAYMIALAQDMGREQAHDLVYEAAKRARESQSSLKSELLADISEDQLPSVTIEGYVGEARGIADRAVRSWTRMREESG